MIKDEQTYEVLLRGYTNKGLYRFSPAVASVACDDLMFTLSVELGIGSFATTKFDLWHR